MLYQIIGFSCQVTDVYRVGGVNSLNFKCTYTSTEIYTSSTSINYRITVDPQYFPSGNIRYEACSTGTKQGSFNSGTFIAIGCSSPVHDPTHRISIHSFSAPFYNATVNIIIVDDHRPTITASFSFTIMIEDFSLTFADNLNTITGSPGPLKFEFNNAQREEKYLIMTPIRVQSGSTCSIIPNSITCTITQENERLIIEFVGDLTNAFAITVDITDVIYPNTRHGRTIHYGRSDVLHGFYSSGSSRLIPKFLYSSEYIPSLSNPQVCTNSRYEFTFNSPISIANSEITLTANEPIETNTGWTASITDGVRSCSSSRVEKLADNKLKLTYTGCTGNIIGNNIRIIINSIRNSNKIGHGISITGDVGCPNEDNNAISECITIQPRSNFIPTSGISFL